MVPLDAATSNKLVLGFMSSNNQGLFPSLGRNNNNNSNEDEKSNPPAASHGDSVYGAVEQRQREQLIQQQLQQQLGSLGSGAAEGKAEETANNERVHAFSPEPPEPPPPPSMLSLDNVLKRQAEEGSGIGPESSDPNPHKRAREHEHNSSLFVPPQPQDPTAQAPSLSLFNPTGAWGPNVAIEPTPLLGNNFATGGAPALNNMDLMMLRDFQQLSSTAAASGASAGTTDVSNVNQNQPGATSILPPSGLTLADQLRLSAATSADPSSQLLQDTRTAAAVGASAAAVGASAAPAAAAAANNSLSAAAHPLLGALGTGPFDPFFGTTATSAAAPLPPQANQLFSQAAAASSANPSAAGMMFPFPAGIGTEPQGFGVAGQQASASSSTPALPPHPSLMAAPQQASAYSASSMTTAPAAVAAPIGTEGNDLGLLMRQLAAVQNSSAGSASSMFAGVGGGIGGSIGTIPGAVAADPSGAPASTSSSISLPPPPTLSAASSDPATQAGVRDSAAVAAAFPGIAAASELGTTDLVASSAAAATSSGSKNEAVPAIMGSELVAVDPSLPRGLPPLDERGNVTHFSERPMFCLGVDEDPNWLSEFHCFVRRELTEVCRANKDDCKTRNNAISFRQVGIRCRFCAHKPSNSRAGRSSAFPSSLRQIYQSFTMMLREHFPNCDSVPADLQKQFASLKDTPSQGATDSKRYWMYSAMKLGMTNSDGEGGIVCSEESVQVGAKMAPFGTNTENQAWPDDATKSIALVLPVDRELRMDDFLYLLLAQCQVVKLHESERIGNRRSLQAGLPGLACRFCCQARRLGLCRLFPARRRTLPGKLNDMYDHLRRCSLAPKAVKDQLDQLQKTVRDESLSDRENSKEFFDRVWARMGHTKTTGGGAGPLG